MYFAHLASSIFRVARAGVLACALIGCSAQAKTAVIQTNLGAITIALDEVAAPKTVANFVQYAQEGHYNGTVFHRVIKDFMVQGGGFDAKYREKPTHAPIANEAGNGLGNDALTVAMARTSVVDSATAQFFINTANNSFLNHRDNSDAGFGYAVFGRVTSGFAVVDAIANSAVKPSAVSEAQPLKPIVIESVKIMP